MSSERMSWILTKLYSYVAGTQDDDDDDDRSSTQETERREAKALVIKTIASSLKHAEDFESAKPQAVPWLYVIVDNNEWTDYNTKYVGLDNGKTRLYVTLPLSYYTTAAFERNFAAGDVVKSHATNEWNMRISCLPEQRQEPCGRFVSQPVVIDERYSIVALLLEPLLMRKLSDELQDCNNADRICTNADYTLEYKRTHEVRLHLNVPINVATSCWTKLPPLEMPMTCERDKFLVAQPKIDDVCEKLREGAIKLDWSKPSHSKLPRPHTISQSVK